MKKKLIIIFGAIILVISVAYFATQNKQKNDSKSQENSTVATTSNLLEITAKNGDTVLSATKRVATVEYSESSSGTLVSSINGKSNSKTEFWMYYINGADGTVAADKYFCKEGDNIKWEYKSF